MYKKILHYTILLLILFSSFFIVSYDSRQESLEDFAYCMALGIDVGEKETLKLSFQIPSDSGSSGGSGGSSGGSSEQSTSSIVYSIDCESIDSGINLMNTYITKQISLSHCMAIVISEEYASLDIAEVIYTLMNKVEISSSCLVVISRGNAQDYLNQASSSIETASARYYDSSVVSSFSTGLIDKITLSDFFSALKDTFREPIASLGSVNNVATQNNNDNSSSTQKDANNKAGESSISNSSSHSENLGLAVFKNSKLVGELNGIETVCHLIITGKLQSYNLTIPDPFNSTDNIDVHITLRKSPKIKLKIINGSPYIDIDVALTARLLSMNNESGYLTQDKLKLIEETCNHYLKEQINSYLYKTSKEYQSDIACFGKYAAPKFLTLDDFYKYNWLDNYKNSFFNVKVDTKMKSGFLLMEM